MRDKIFFLLPIVDQCVCRWYWNWQGWIGISTYTEVKDPLPFSSDILENVATHQGRHVYTLKMFGKILNVAKNSEENKNGSKCYSKGKGIQLYLLVYF